MKQLIAAVVVGLCIATAVWQSRRMRQTRIAGAGTEQSHPHPLWLDRLYSRNPRDVEAASQEVAALGVRALPVIEETLRDPHSEAERLKAALKASGILGKVAAPIVDDVAAVLSEPGLTAEAAVALSYMGPDAFQPLRDALSDTDPIVRREALRSIGKLKDRAPLAAALVVPALIERMKDPDAGVRAVAATYLGIIHEESTEAVPALIAGLSDADPEVRRTSAAALGSFGADAAPALRALKKAASDSNDDVAREAGRTMVKLQQK